jgi:hypothetical protein
VEGKIENVESRIYDLAKDYGLESLFILDFFADPRSSIP